jgi:hypothetical protein
LQNDGAIVRGSERLTPVNLYPLMVATSGHGGSMSESTVRREIAALRGKADKLEAMCNDASHVFNDESHREHLRHEVERLRAEAKREEERLELRLRTHPAQPSPEVRP